jgi:hypothetical protein
MLLCFPIYNAGKEPFYVDMIEKFIFKKRLMRAYYLLVGMFSLLTFPP